MPQRTYTITSPRKTEVSTGIIHNALSDDVFKAKTQRQETAGAETILEGGETQVEKPIDQEEAQEVEEDETAGLEQSKVWRRERVLMERVLMERVLMERVLMERVLMERVLMDGVCCE